MPFLYILYEVDESMEIENWWHLADPYARPSHTRSRVLAHTHTVKYNKLPNTESDEQYYCFFFVFSSLILMNPIQTYNSYIHPLTISVDDNSVIEIDTDIRKTHTAIAITI